MIRGNIAQIEKITYFCFNELNVLRINFND